MSFNYKNCQKGTDTLYTIVDHIEIYFHHQINLCEIIVKAYTTRYVKKISSRPDKSSQKAIT